MANLMNELLSAKFNRRQFIKGSAAATAAEQEISCAKSKKRDPCSLLKWQSSVIFQQHRTLRCRSTGKLPMGLTARNQCPVFPQRPYRLI